MLVAETGSGPADERPFSEAVAARDKPVQGLVRRLMTIPEIGFISACTLVAYLEQGGLFRNKRQAWQYASLKVSRHVSAGKGTENASRSSPPRH